jgi:hypothetical protein
LLVRARVALGRASQQVKFLVLFKGAQDRRFVDTGTLR